MSQQSHRSDPRILNRRTLQRDHSYLPRVLRKGMAVLDVGCGTGSITADIAKAIGPGGMVLGIDRDDANLAVAVQEHRGIGNLRFENADILTFDVDNRFNSSFDIVTAARTIQWISEPERAVARMRKAAKPEGHVIVLDYNLAETSWEPEPPADFRRFYQAFLDWRTANNWNNRTASRLAEFFESVGLVDITSHAADEIVRRGDPDFSDAHASRIWLHVIETVGPNLVQAGLLDEGVRHRAEEHYRTYIQHTLRLQRLSMLTVDGRVLS
jgi:ubiquinone/menaquinone biosynthesis C-methylase UbiE